MVWHAPWTKVRHVTALGTRTRGRGERLHSVDERTFEHKAFELRYERVLASRRRDYFRNRPFAVSNFLSASIGSRCTRTDR